MKLISILLLFCILNGCSQELKANKTDKKQKMTEELIKKFNDNINREYFVSAYEILVNEIEKSGVSDQIIHLSKKLSNKVRTKAYKLASNRGTEMSREAYETEALLRLIIKFNGEGIYR